MYQYILWYRSIIVLEVSTAFLCWLSSEIFFVRMYMCVDILRVKRIEMEIIITTRCRGSRE